MEAGKENTTTNTTKVRNNNEPKNQSKHPIHCHQRRKPQDGHHQSSQEGNPQAKERGTLATHSRKNKKIAEDPTKNGEKKKGNRKPMGGEAKQKGGT